MRPNIDQHDYEVKMRAVNKFLNTGDKVKVTMRFRGREMAHQELGMKLLHRVRDETEEIAKVEQHPKMDYFAGRGRWVGTGSAGESGSGGWGTD